MSKEYGASSNAVAHWEISLAKSFTTSDIFTLLENRRLNCFMYNGNGSGCLTWTTRLVKELEDIGALPAGALASFYKTVAGVRANPECWVPDESGAVFF